MSMFSELNAGKNADDVAIVIIKRLESNPEDKKVLEEVLLPLYRKHVDDSWGCHDREYERRLNDLFKD